MVWVGMASCLVTWSSPRLGGSPFNGSLASEVSALVAFPHAPPGTGRWGAQGRLLSEVWRPYL